MSTSVTKGDSAIFNRLRAIVGANSAADTDLRENSNTNADTSMGAMLKAGSETLKEYYLTEVVAPEFAEAHRSGLIHIHDLDFYGFTTTCLQLDLDKLFSGGFFTGHGTVRTPQSIRNYWSLLCIAIQASQNDQHGGQSIPLLEYYLAPGVAKSFARILGNILTDALGKRDEHGVRYAKEFRDLVMAEVYAKHGTVLTEEALSDVSKLCVDRYGVAPTTAQIRSAILQTTDECMQGAEACVHNLCTMASRAGAQVPFSSVNYGLGTTAEQRMVIACMLQALENGLGDGEAQIFPIHVFRVKSGINYEEGTPNHDLLLKAIQVTAKRMFPNYLFVDAPFNLKYYDADNPDSQVATMGCRTRVIGNVNGPELTPMRGNLSFTTLNLPRLAILAEGNIDRFFASLDEVTDLCVRQLLERFEMQCARLGRSFPMLMGNHMYMGSDDIGPNSTLREALKHGTLSVGYIGLAETLIALTGKHHGESAAAQELGLKIIGRMRELMDEATTKHHLNFTLLATPAESAAGTLLRKDVKEFGVIPGVTDKEYYVNSSHIPPAFNIAAKRKIELEAPYHAFANAGHITYVEFPGDPEANPDAMLQLVKWMYETGTGYGAINRAIDTCRECGFSGIIDTECPECGNNDPSTIIRLRRVTGYLVGDVNSRFCDSKKAEERDRVKHCL